MGKKLKYFASLKYLAVGALCAALNLAIQAGAMLLGAHYAVASVVSFVVLVPLSYHLHKVVTFRSAADLPPVRFLLYTAQWSWLLVLNIALVAVFVDLLKFHVGLALVLVALIVHVVSYLYSRSYVFADPDRASEH